MSVDTTPVAEALSLWTEITGLSPEAQVTRLGEYEIKRTYGDLQEAADLDHSEITVGLLLGHFFNSYLDDQKVSLGALLRKSGDIESRMRPIRRLQEVLSRPEFTARQREFVDGIRAAMAHYGAADRDDVQALLAKQNVLGILRRDAFRSMRELRLNQFLSGAPEPSGKKPIYLGKVHQWWNVQSLLAGIMNMPSGVSLQMVRHPDAYQSYFAFVIRNGANVFVLSDTPKQAHPLQGYMSRRPDRDLERRIGEHWFPYELLNLAFDEESQRLYVDATKVTALAIKQQHHLPLRELANLGAMELVWISMMFELIVEKFWKRGWQAEALSYTGEQIRDAEAISSYARSLNLPVKSYAALDIPALTLADVGDDAASEDAVGSKYGSPNRWLEDRYAARVPVDALNLVEDAHIQMAIERRTGQIQRLNRKNVDRRGFGSGEHPHTYLEAMNSTSFGTKEELEADRLFLARHNYAAEIDRLAEVEFQERRKEVEGWYLAKVRGNLERLKSWAWIDGLWVSDGEHCDFHRHAGRPGRVRYTRVRDPETFRSFRSTRQRIFHSIIDRHAADDPHRYTRSPEISFDFHGGRAQCILTGGASVSWDVLFSPTNPSEIALIAGVDVSDLPDVLQHWNLATPYQGNSILQRVDPMLWNVDNPWLKLDLRVRLFLSKRGLSKVLTSGERPPINALTDEELKRFESAALASSVLNQRAEGASQ